MVKAIKKTMLANKYALPIVLISAVCAYFLDYLLHDGFSGIIFFAFNVVFVVFGIWLWYERGKKLEEKPTKLVLVWLGLSLLLSAWLFIRDSIWLYFFNSLTSLMLMGLFIVNSQKSKLVDLEIDFFAPLKVLGQVLVKMTYPIRSVIHFNKFSIGNKWSFIKGLILALPVVLFVFALLYSADLIVQKYFDEFYMLFDFTFLDNYITHIFIVIYFLLFSGTFYSLIRMRRNYNIEGLQVRRRDKLAIYIMAILVGGIMFVFLSLQAKYLFGGPELVEALGIGYQKYAHQGFYQLMVVAVINFFIVWLLTDKTNFLKRPDKKDLVLSLVLIGETLFLLACAMKRLFVFIDTLQWATKRFFAIEGMIFFAVLLLIFCIHLFIKKFTRQHFVYMFTILFAVNILFINIMNPDKFIAKKNVAVYVDQGALESELDFDYTAYVSADAVDQGLRLFENARNEEEKKRAAISLEHAYSELVVYNAKVDKRIVYWNFAKRDAYFKLKENIEDIHKYFPDEKEKIRR